MDEYLYLVTYEPNRPDDFISVHNLTNKPALMSAISTLNMKKDILVNGQGTWYYPTKAISVREAMNKFWKEFRNRND